MFRADVCAEKEGACRLQGSSNSYAIKKKDEIERVAKSYR